MTLWGFSVERLALDSSVGLNNPNDLAAWFGFCSVYFFIVSIETKRHAVRLASWPAALGCLYVVGLTVSRGRLLAVAVAAVIALRRLLKHGFFPILLLIILSWVVYTLGLFDQIVAFYSMRGTEETGRLVVWPLALERFLSSPLVGVGGANIGTRVSIDGNPIEPHNGFLHIALASGIIPLIFFMAYWIRAAAGAFRSNTAQLPDAPFLIPLLVYAFMVMWSGNATFMHSWIIVTLSAALTTSAPRRVHRDIVRQVGRNKILERSRRRDRTGHGTARYQFS
jgi:O-antigen ligase